MLAEELRSAVQSIVQVLTRADLLAIIRQYRAARPEQQTVAAARLGHAGAVILQNLESPCPAQRSVVRCLHLEELTTAVYWEKLLESTANRQATSAELVRLYSRVMFATGHLPKLLDLLDTLKAPEAPAVVRPPTGEGEALMVIRLADAGERATDPDRIARAIDGIDMLYSACASLARKPSIDLKLHSIVGDVHRDIQMVGDQDSVLAVVAVIESIPEVLDQFADDADLNIDDVVSGLPVFADLSTLGKLGTVPRTELENISETMRQGAILALESGVILHDSSDSSEHPHTGNDAGEPPGSSSLSGPHSTAESEARVHADNVQSFTGFRESPSEEPPQNQTRDEHYERYLAEREAMQRANGTNGRLQPAHHHSHSTAVDDDAVEALLKSLGEARGDRH